MLRKIKSKILKNIGLIMKTRDPYPITDVYLLEMNADDAATVTVGDLCERLTNDLKLDGEQVAQ